MPQQLEQVDRHRGKIDDDMARNKVDQAITLQLSFFKSL